jgi:PAS domain S-box-containing protein
LDKILIIDDEEGIRKVLQIILSQSGYTVLCAADGREGLDLVERERPAVVVTDIRMPGVDGIELLRTVKAGDDAVEVIVITGHGEMSLAIEALKLRASDFINKPISNDAILLAVERAFERIALRRQLEEHTQTLERKVKEATEELQRVNAFQSNLIRSSIDGIIATDASSRIVIFNESAQRLSGYSQEEVLAGKTLLDIFPRGIARRMQRFLDESSTAPGGRAILRREASLRCKGGGTVPVRLSGKALRQDGRTVGSVWSVEDLRELRLLEERLIQRERMAAMGETVAGMAHAVKNILGGLTGGSFVLEKGLELSRDDLVKQGWDMLRRNVARIRELVLDLLSYAKEREPELGWCDPGEILADVLHLMGEGARRFGVEIREERAPLSSEWYLDRRWVHRCLTNLVGNAIDACSEPFAPASPGRVTVALHETGKGELCFAVTDNGCGMDAETRQRIFTSFFSTKGSQGTGLGLMLTQKMVKEHGGRIDFQSTPGKGSTFRIILPRLTPTETHARSRGATSQGP